MQNSHSTTEELSYSTPGKSSSTKVNQYPYDDEQYSYVDEFQSLSEQLSYSTHNTFPPTTARRYHKTTVEHSNQMDTEQASNSTPEKLSNSTKDRQYPTTADEQYYHTTDMELDLSPSTTEQSSNPTSGKLSSDKDKQYLTTGGHHFPPSSKDLSYSTTEQLLYSSHDNSSPTITQQHQATTGGHQHSTPDTNYSTIDDEFPTSDGQYHHSRTMDISNTTTGNHMNSTTTNPSANKQGNNTSNFSTRGIEGSYEEDIDLSRETQLEKEESFSDKAKESTPTTRSGETLKEDCPCKQTAADSSLEDQEQELKLVIFTVSDKKCVPEYKVGKS